MNDKTEWVLVPRVPTPEMVQASDDISCRAEGAEHWADMLAAAPQHPAEAQAQGGGEVAFAEWLATEMPAGTIIGDPAWWAERIARQYAKRCAPPSAPVGVEAMPGLRSELSEIVHRHDADMVTIEPNEAAAILRALAQQPAAAQEGK